METERKDLVAFSPEERKRAVELYLTTSMTTAEVVEHLGYPTRQCLERWLAKDPRYAGRMRSPVIPLETRQKVIDCHDGKTVAYTAGYSPNAQLANTMPEKAAATLPKGARPLVRSNRGCHYRWPGWLELMERFGLTRSTGAKDCSPDNAAAEGFFGGMKVESVYLERWEERTRGEVLALIDEYVHWYNHDRIKQSLGWMSPVQYRLSHGLAA